MDSTFVFKSRNSGQESIGIIDLNIMQDSPLQEFWFNWRLHSVDQGGGGLRSIACWIAGSNPDEDMDACLVFVVCCVGSGLCSEESLRVYVWVWVSECEWERECVYESVCVSVSVCVCVRERECVYECVCVCERVCVYA